ncbi:hypothetical protein EYF80_054648 [Liparis tanakae]|uniref:Uncharacterized protein n=1 Tax=Liparis tanakae TaxID=230148 RepID=A0A4Z2F1V1_9TELE|nr:hypothetical protein EYF80_054648 [Liparis tanakae]
MAWWWRSCGVRLSDALLQKSPMKRTTRLALSTEPAGQVQDLGVRQVQDRNQSHGRTGFSQSASQTFLQSWQMKKGRKTRG